MGWGVEREEEEEEDPDPTGSWPLIFKCKCIYFRHSSSDASRINSLFLKARRTESMTWDVMSTTVKGVFPAPFPSLQSLASLWFSVVCYLHRRLHMHSHTNATVLFPSR